MSSFTTHYQWLLLYHIHYSRNISEFTKTVWDTASKLFQIAIIDIIDYEYEDIVSKIDAPEITGVSAKNKTKDVYAVANGDWDEACKFIDDQLSFCAMHYNFWCFYANIFVFRSGLVQAAIFWSLLIFSQ